MSHSMYICNFVSQGFIRCCFHFSQTPDALCEGVQTTLLFVIEPFNNPQANNFLRKQSDARLTHFSVCAHRETREKIVLFQYNLATGDMRRLGKKNTSLHRRYRSDEIYTFMHTSTHIKLIAIFVTPHAPSPDRQ